MFILLSPPLVFLQLACFTLLALVCMSWSPMFSEKALLLSTTLIVIASAALDVSLCPAHSTIRLHSVVSNIFRELLLGASHVAQALQSYSTVATVVSSGVRKPGLEAHLWCSQPYFVFMGQLSPFLWLNFFLYKVGIMVLTSGGCWKDWINIWKLLSIFLSLSLYFLSQPHELTPHSNYRLCERGDVGNREVPIQWCLPGILWQYQSSSSQRIPWDYTTESLLTTLLLSSFLLTTHGLKHPSKLFFFLSPPPELSCLSCHPFVSLDFPSLLTLHYPKQNAHFKTLYKKLGKIFSHNCNHQNAFIKNAIPLDLSYKEVAIYCSRISGNSKCKTTNS